MANIQQTDAGFAVLAVCCGQARPVILNRELQPTASNARPDGYESRFGLTAQSMLDAVLDQRLKQEAWHKDSPCSMVNLQVGLKTIPETHPPYPEKELEGGEFRNFCDASGWREG